MSYDIYKIIETTPTVTVAIGHNMFPSKSTPDFELELDLPVDAAGADALLIEILDEETAIVYDTRQKCLKIMDNERCFVADWYGDETPYINTIADWCRHVQQLE